MDRLASVLERIKTDPALLAQVEASRRRYNDKRKTYVKARHQRDPAFAADLYYRSLLSSALRGKGRSRTFKRAFGYLAAELRSHVEKLFQPGMTWQNYGKAWEIHHILPLSSFNLAFHDQLHACFDKANLQPVTEEEHKRLTAAYRLTIKRNIKSVA